MRIIFAGSPAIAIPALRILSGMEMEGKGVALAGLITNPDCVRSRCGCDEPTAVSAAAFELNAERSGKGFPPIPQIKAEKLGVRVRQEIAALAPDMLVAFACMHIFGPRFLALFPLGGINIHPSLLPKYRGASPIPAVILAREKETGICIQRLAAGIDSGDILAVDRFRLTGRETTLSLSETVSVRAAMLLKELLENFDSLSAHARPQEGEPVYCSQIKKEEGIIDWNKSAVEIDAQIRAYTPWPLSFTCRGKDTLLILEARPLDTQEASSVKSSAPGGTPGSAVPGTVLANDKNRGLLIQTGDGILAVTRLQWQAKKALDWKAFCNGARDFIGSQLG